MIISYPNLVIDSRLKIFIDKKKIVFVTHLIMNLHKLTIEKMKTSF
jgi:hypothetical protein